MSSSRINNCPASLRHGLGQVENHLPWDGHHVLLKCLQQLTHIWWGLENIPPTRSECDCWAKSGDQEDQGRIGDVVVEEELCGVAYCMGSGVVVLKYSVIRRLMCEIKRQKICGFLVVVVFLTLYLQLTGPGAWQAICVIEDPSV